MRTPVTLEDELVAKAQAYTGLTEKSALIRDQGAGPALRLAVGSRHSAAASRIS